jgi:hypothetical protein
MLKRLNLILIILLATTTQFSIAQNLRDYRCVIERIATAPVLPESSQEFLRSTYLGKDFTVDRRTGIMAGTLKNSYITRPQVIDLGSKDNSYKVVTTMRKEEGAGSGSMVYVLTINEFDPATKKPFIFLENATAYFGTCINF